MTAPTAYCPACAATKPPVALKTNPMNQAYAEYPCGTVKEWSDDYLTLDGKAGAWRVAVSCVEVNAPYREHERVVQSVEQSLEG